MLQVVWRIPLYTQWTPEGVPIYGFGVMLFLTFLATTWLASKRAPREGIHPDTVQDLAIWLFLGGLLGARLTSLFSTGHYPPLLSPAGMGQWLYKLISIWDGGIVLYGSLLGGAAAFFLAWFLYYRKKGMQVRRFADLAAPSIALGLVLGRVGCFLNGCCYGQVACAACLAPATFPMCAPPRDVTVAAGYQTVAGFTTDGRKAGKVDPDSPAFAAGLREGSLITAVNGAEVKSAEQLDLALGSLGTWEPRGRTRLDLAFIPPGSKEAQTISIYPRTVGLYPTQLYEVMSMFLLLLVLLAYYPLRHNPGQVAAVLMVGYGIHRYLNELLRDDPRPKGLESYGSVFLVAGGLLMWTWLAFKAPDPPPPPVDLQPPGGEKPKGDAGGVDQDVAHAAGAATNPGL